MTPNQSDRADGRLYTIRGAALAQLRGHQPLLDLLEQSADVPAGDAPTRIVAAPDLSVLHQSQSSDAPGVAIGVANVTGSSQRMNAHAEKNFVVQCGLQLREQVMKSQGVAWMDRILDEQSAVMTEHIPEWQARGTSGSTPEPVWNDKINRYQSICRYDVRRWD